MSDDRETLLEFPCEFPVKAMGRADEDFVLRVVELVREHVPDLDESRVATSASRRGNYVSVTITFTAISQAQIDAVYLALNADDQVVMTL
ncbi:putative lipoic acid-binding regulatory protein [Natronocella acetinitrilica]|uniref:UPF0250 protein J2T57_000063 n=1 Tax=Natronocella acetinitrilica TaxID=414046 RepID=A0AAE3G1H5_9GAMM|nr:DUF493 domain-containing protein [Natronocella acetinitrilica]MCP1672971.1 putative lipoic acid-binding regulatory protein [Natronocella acetinitrilica]